MRRTGVLLAAGIALGGLLGAGCRARPEIAPGTPPSTPVARVQLGESVQAKDEAAAELASRFPLPAPQGDDQDIALDDTACVNCHTDEEAVKTLAVEPEEEEELSEGEG
jgi:hypothetical protein